MRFVKANPNEYLIVARRGRIVNRGQAGSAFLWPGATYVLIPSTQQEATFEMTQETKDSIPLRFKGIVIYRVAEPEAAARQFDFAAAGGHTQIKTLLSHVCLGELRAVVSQMTMDECIQQRKTTLTDTVASALQQVIQGRQADQGWGIALDVVQVAQVFIVDQELRRQLEAEVRNAIRVTSELSEIQSREGLKIAQTNSERRLQQETLAVERERLEIAGEKLRLQREYDRRQIAGETPNRLLQIAQQVEILRQELEKSQLEIQVRERKVQLDLIEETARQALRKEVLPLEQAPEMARALAGMLHGINLSVYGQDSSLLTALTPLVNLLAETVRKGRSQAGESGSSEP